jgi:hypothetical protein
MFGDRREEERRAEEKEEELRKIILAPNAPKRGSEEAKRAIAYCELCARSYGDWFEWNESQWLLWQRITIIGGVVATLAGVITLPEAWLAKAHWLESFSWLRGVPAAISTVAAGFLGSFNYKEDAVRHELTSNGLWSELAKYQACAVPYNVDEAPATSIFLTNVCRLVDSELSNWRALVMGKASDDDQSRRAVEDEKKKT